MAALAPLASPTLHRPFRDPQHGSDLPVLPVSLEARHGLAPDPLPRVSLDVGQAAALRISHRTRTTEATFTLSGEQPDITRSSSVAAKGIAAVVAWGMGTLLVRLPEAPPEPLESAAPCPLLTDPAQDYVRGGPVKTAWPP